MREASLSKFLHDAGAKVIGISDAYGALHDPNGLDIDYLLDRRDSFGTVTTLFENTITNKELLELDCDILFRLQLKTKSLKKTLIILKQTLLLKLQMVQQQLKLQKFLQIAEYCLCRTYLRSAGGVTVSYFEWVQNNRVITGQKKKYGKK